MSFALRHREAGPEAIVRVAIHGATSPAPVDRPEAEPLRIECRVVLPDATGWTSMASERLRHVASVDLAVGVPRKPVQDPPARRQHVGRQRGAQRLDRKSTRLNSSHSSISYAVFCLKKKKKERGRYVVVKNTNSRYE